MNVLADSLPYQPHTATGYGFSGLSGLLLLLAIFWIFRSGSGGSNDNSTRSSNQPGGIGKGNTVWVIVLVIGSLWAFGKSQDNPDSSPPSHPSTTVTTPHQTTPPKSGSGGSSCSLICFQPEN